MLATPPLSNKLEPKGSVAADELALPEPIVALPAESTKAGNTETTSPTLQAQEGTSPDPTPQRAPRRKNHSEIERRRRERVNAKYNELRELVPACRAFRFARRGGDAGLHKLDILTEAVKYIHELQKDLETARKRDVTRISYVMN